MSTTRNSKIRVRVYGKSESYSAFVNRPCGKVQSMGICPVMRDAFHVTLETGEDAIVYKEIGCGGKSVRFYLSRFLRCSNAL